MIERIYIHNYRCFENFTLDLKGKPSALIIGKNGSGKSTLRHALGVLQGVARNVSRATSLVTPGDFARGRVSVPMRFEVDVVLSDRRHSYSISFVTAEPRQEVRIGEEGLTVDGNPVVVRDSSGVELLGRPKFALEPHLAALSLFGEMGGGDDLQRLKRYLASLLLLAPVPGQMSGFAERETPELTPTADNIAGWLWWWVGRHPEWYTRLRTELQHVMPDFESLAFEDRGSTGKRLVVRFHPTVADAPPLALDFEHLSDGEKCFILGAGVVAFTRKENPLFCFWDEPDNHLSLPEVGHFVMQLRRTVHAGGQFIATSHHPEAIRRFSDENTLVLARDTHTAPPTVRTLEEIGYHGDLMSAIQLGEVMV
jgi:ABC-type transport system involved in cytochrome c biogenesis ATPase subunit